MTGLLDLQKELTCSICTEILYQPLTLLDCLHTFCGSCLHGWFTHQAKRAAGKVAHPYTCPSCRASVRETRPNATVTTLLEMFVQANPGNDRTAQEKDEMKKVYKAGDNVIPKLDTSNTAADEEDRRMVEEIREMSLRDVGARGPRTYERGVRHRNRGHDARDDETRQRRRRDGSGAGDRAAGSIDSRSQARQIEHQSSLRSLLGSSDIDSAEIEEEILRQIMEEGLLDGIDLNNLDVSQEDELSERIAEAYRRRHGRQSRSPGGSSSRHEISSDLLPRPLNTPASRRNQRRSTSTAGNSTSPSLLPVSRPQIFETNPSEHRSRGRTASETRRQTAPTNGSPSVRQEAARSATDLSNRSQEVESGGARPNNLTVHGRRSTDPRPRPSSGGVATGGSESPRSSESRTARSQVTSNVRTESPTSASQTTSHTAAAGLGILTRDSVNIEAERQAPSGNLSVADSSNVRPSSSSSTGSRNRPMLYEEPAISCDRCGKKDIQYDLHESCSACKEGNYNLCHHCYRLGLGCLHWFGFGTAAWHRFQQQGSPDQQLPHTLVGHRYLRPRPESFQPFAGDNTRKMTSEDPAMRLQSGAFCSNCSAFADDCFWKCDTCNDGEWGFCNRCVNQGKCCTHALLPVAHISSSMHQGTYTDTTHHSEASFAPIMSPRMMQAFPTMNSTPSGQYRPLTFSTNCDICRYPIQPSQTRFHCYQCNDGDYDICTTSYHKLIASGRISRENGDRGWRRCLRGHRMILAGFEDTAAGQRRVIVKDLVGGHALKDEGGTPSKYEWSWREGQGRQTKTVVKQVSNTDASVPTTIPMLQKFPPDGGVGMVGQVIWSYLPQESATDELSFPRRAEVREIEDVNGEWFWGCYAGTLGLFPAEYVRIVELVTM